MKNACVFQRDLLICSLLGCSENKNPPLENNIHIFTPPCNILYIISIWYRRDVIISKYAPSVRGEVVCRIFVAPFLVELLPLLDMQIMRDITMHNDLKKIHCFKSSQTIEHKWGDLVINNSLRTYKFSLSYVL